MLFGLHGGTIAYTLEVSYDSIDGARTSSLSVTDPGCDAAPAETLDVDGFNIGDDDQDGYLDDGETWTFTCSVVTGSHDDAETDVTNTAFADGTDFDGDALEQAESNETSVPFSADAGTLSITKSADADGDDLFDEANGDDGHTAHGGTIAYTLEVTYESDDNAPATNVTVTEADCTLGAASGDTDGDNRLDESETWVYSCDYTVPAHADDEDDPLTNTATADGDDFDGDPLATVTSNTTSVDIRHAPSVTVTGLASVDESGTAEHEYSFTVTDADPGDTFVIATGFPTCGVSADRGPATSVVTTSTGGAFNCKFRDGHIPAISENVTVKVTDNTSLSSNVATQPVTVNNVAPTLNFIAPLVASANEGDTKTFSVSVSDPGLDAFVALAGFPDCGTGGILIGSFVPTSSGGTFQCRFPDGPSTATDPTVRMRVEDSDGADSNIAMQLVDVANIAPTLSNPAFVYNPFFGTGSAGIDYSDPGYPDTHTAVFDWARLIQHQVIQPTSIITPTPRADSPPPTRLVRAASRER